jgi:Mg-chelatase subunit ChlD
VLFGLIEMDETYFGDLKRIASRPDVFAPAGKTAIGDTLLAGAEILAQSGTIFKSLIIITDGENTSGENPANVLQAVVDNRNNKSTKDFPVLTSDILVSFVGFDIESDAFASLGKIGSRVTSAASKTALNESLKNLFLADITKLEAN